MNAPSLQSLIFKDSTAPSDKKKNRFIILVEQAAIWFSAAATLTILGKLWRLSNFGLDLTDESYYLVWISNPWSYSFSTSQYGYIYHPLYRLLDGSVAALRQSNILITFLLSFVLCVIFVRTVCPPCHDEDSRRTRFSIISAAALACSSLIFLDSWLPTPSYNSLNLQALLLAGIGLLLAKKDFSTASTLGWILVGLGGWAAFMAKPTTAAGLGVCVFLYLIFSGRLNCRLLAVSVSLSVILLLLSAWVIDGSILAFIHRLDYGAKMLGLVEGKYGFSHLFRFSNPHLQAKELSIVGCSTGAVLGAIFLCVSKNTRLNRLAAMLWLVLSLLSLAIIFNVVIPRIDFQRFQGALILAVPFAATATSLIAGGPKIFLRLPRSNWALILCFAVFPYVYSLGTNNNYWETGSDACIFWVLTGLVFLGAIIPQVSDPHRVLLTLGLATQLVTVILLNTGFERPYRQNQPLRQNDRLVEIGPSHSRLVLSRGYAEYLQAIKYAAERAGFGAGTPVIDFTGRSPGVLHHLGAESIGQAWMIGGYKGSNPKALEALKLVPCRTIASAWLLTEPDGPRALSLEILKQFRLSASEDFEIVGSFFTPAGGYLEGRKQLLLRPVHNNAARKKCGCQSDSQDVKETK